MFQHVAHREKDAGEIEIHDGAFHRNAGRALHQQCEQAVVSQPTMNDLVLVFSTGQAVFIFYHQCLVLAPASN